MTLNIKIEILKVFSLDLNFSSNKDVKFKKEEKDDKTSDDAPDTTKSK